MNFFKWHIGDYARDTEHLSWDEDMAYTRLMRVYYRDEKPLPVERRKIYRLARCQSAGQRAAIDTVLSEFFSEEADGWHNKRCDMEIRAAQDKALHNQTVGKLGGRPPKTQTQEVSKPKPNENPVGLLSKPTDNPIQTPDSKTPLAKEESEKDICPPAHSHTNGNGAIHPVELEANSTSPVETVFEHWKTTWNKPKAKLDPKRKKIIRTALQTYPPETLCESIAGYRKSPFHRGKNDRQAEYGDIETLLRDSKHIEAGLQFALSPEARQWE